jgi:hypothetical protein
MKRRILIPIVCTIVAGVLVAGCFGSSKDKKKTLTGSYGISGYVVTPDGAGLSGATVVLDQGGSEIGDSMTGSNGSYSFANLPLGSYTVFALSNGYTYGQTSVDVTADGSSVKNIVLTRLQGIENRAETVQDADAVQTNGLVVEVNFQTPVGSAGGTETVSQAVSLSIPAGCTMTLGGGALTGNVTFAATPLQMNQIPEAPADVLATGTVFLEPSSATFDPPVEVSIPMGIRLAPGTVIPLRRIQNEQWVSYGTGVVDATGLSATAMVSEFGQISVQPQVTVTTSSEKAGEETVEEVEIPLNTQESVSFTVSTEISFPGGLPEGVTQSFVEALVHKLDGSPTGTQTLTVDLPTFTSSKPAMVMDPAGTEAFNTWKVTLFLKTENRSITINVSGTTFSIPYEYKFYEPVVERKELLHSTGDGNT